MSLFRFLWRGMLSQPKVPLLGSALESSGGQFSGHRHLSTLIKASGHDASPGSPLTSNQTKSSGLLSPATVQCQSVRTNVRVYYKGSAWKRYNKHNIEKRLTSPGGLDMLWRKALKGKWQLAAYERILPNTTNAKILPTHAFKFRPQPITKRRLPKRELL